MPIQATPDSVRPIQTPLPRISEQRDDQQRGDRDVVHAGVIRCAASRRCLRDCARLPRSSSTSSSTKAMARISVPTAMRELRHPQRRGVVAGRDVVERVRLPGQPARCRTPTSAGQQRRPRPATRSRARAARAAVQRRQQQRDADVLAALEGVRQRQEARAGHQVAGIGVGAAARGSAAARPTIDSSTIASSADHEQRRQRRRRRRRGRRAARRMRLRCGLLAEGVDQRPCRRGRPCRATPSASCRRPSSCRPSAAPTAATMFMPLAFSLSSDSVLTFLLAAQPRASASAAAFSTAALRRRVERVEGRLVDDAPRSSAARPGCRTST